MQAGGIAPTVLNAANEVAVERFLKGQIGFMSIAKVVEAAIERSVSEIGVTRAETLEDVLETDRVSRILAEDYCTAHAVA
jgi:1-deoxy-D-xylulose-5-phosphate reductoisomerase